MNELTPEQRVEVARDVILQLNKRRFRGSSSVFISSNRYVGDPVNHWPDSEDVRSSIFRHTGRRCKVCAKGALVVSAFLMYDGKLGDYGGWLSGTSRIAQNLFGDWMADHMEHYFEYKWIDKYKNDTLRLRRIMENVVDNEGYFIPNTEFLNRRRR